jgi:diaminohydroxyphosphoribosylaminopyrimidine deaminase/5-amino-6-(5-phosphoribosylamino)uracil reductase
LQKECDECNEDYFHWTRTRQPWVILKLAMTLDGSLAVPGRRWITGAEARAEVQNIRAGCDAILVGAETVRRDNPRLTVRSGVGQGQPWRAVVTKSGVLPARAKIFTDAQRDRTVIYRNRAWESVLGDLYGRGVRRLLVEGGAKTAAGLIAAGKVNEVVLFFAPETVEQGHPRVADWAGWRWKRAAVSRAGRDLCLRGTLKGAK